MAKVRFTSPKMHTDLAALGIVPKKSRVLTWPATLSPALVNSYLLGILDGDGWITIDRRKQTPHYVTGFISASPAFPEQAAQEINKAIGIPLARLGRVNTAFSIRYGGHSAILLSNGYTVTFLACLAREYLKRK